MSDPSLAPVSLAAWETNAAHWDSSIGKDGNKYWRVLQEPSLSRLLRDHLSRGKVKALDLATGNGLCARWLAAQGANVVATDGSEGMLERARAYVTDSESGKRGRIIKVFKLDVTSEEDWEGFVEEDMGSDESGFDVILMNMAIMDVATLEPLVKALPKLLRKGGVFVGTIPHPLLFTPGNSRFIDVQYDPETGEQKVVRGLLVKQYLSVAPSKGVAVANQPEKQFYFHRPIGELFSEFFKGGLVLNGMEELGFSEEDGNKDRVEASSNYTQIPAVLSFRFRLPG